MELDFNCSKLIIVLQIELVPEQLGRVASTTLDYIYQEGFKPYGGQFPVQRWSKLQILYPSIMSVHFRTSIIFIVLHVKVHVCQLRMYVDCRIA